MTRRAPAPLIAAFLIAGAGVAGLAATSNGARPFVINESRSLPRGLYLRAPHRRPSPGAIVVARPPASARAYLASLGIAPRARLLKRIAGVGGTTVCAVDRRVRVGDRALAVLVVDRRGVALPRWRGCRRLAPGEVFLAGDTPTSFDSRYFGPVAVSALGGVYRRGFTW